MISILQPNLVSRTKNKQKIISLFSVLVCWIIKADCFLWTNFEHSVLFHVWVVQEKWPVHRHSSGGSPGWGWRGEPKPCPRLPLSPLLHLPLPAGAPCFPPGTCGGTLLSLTTLSHVQHLLLQCRSTVSAPKNHGSSSIRALLQTPLGKQVRWVCSHRQRPLIPTAPLRPGGTRPTALQLSRAGAGPRPSPWRDRAPLSLPPSALTSPVCLPTWGLPLPRRPFYTHCDDITAHPLWHGHRPTAAHCDTATTVLPADLPWPSVSAQGAAGACTHAGPCQPGSGCAAGRRSALGRVRWCLQPFTVTAPTWHWASGDGNCCLYRPAADCCLSGGKEGEGEDMARHVNCLPTFRHLNLVVCNLVLEDTMRDPCALCSGGHDSSEVFWSSVSGWGEYGPRNAARLSYFSIRDEPLFWQIEHFILQLTINEWMLNCLLHYTYSVKTLKTQRMQSLADTCHWQERLKEICVIFLV